MDRPLRIITQTANTITFGYDPVPGCEGYQYFADGAAVSRTLDPSRAQIKFAKGASSYRVVPLDLTLRQDGFAYPAITTDAIFDGRASRLAELRGSTLTGNNNAYHDPEVWGHIGDGDRSEGLYFMGDDISLVSDPEYGQVYLVETNGSSQNPYWTDDDVCSAEMTHDYQLPLGQEIWGTGATKLDPANTLTSWQTLQQVAYPTLSSPPFGIYMHQDGFGIERHYGPIPSVGQQASGYDNKTLHPWDTIKGKWIEYMCAIKMATDPSGSIRVWTRVKANNETELTLRYQATGVTYQWIEGQSPKLSVMDKLGHYWGGNGAKSTWPTNRVWHRGWMRFTDEASARANLS